MATKRKRGPNYTPQEIELLMNLVKKHHSTVEEKKLTGPFLQQKKEVWNKICVAYNSEAISGSRSVEQLKILYDNQKQNAKKKKEHVKKDHTTEDSRNNVRQDEDDKEQVECEDSFSLTFNSQEIKMLTEIKQQLSGLSKNGDNKTILIEGDTTSNESVQERDVGDSLTDDDHILPKHTGPKDGDQSYTDSHIINSDNEHSLDGVKQTADKMHLTTNKNAEYYKRLYFIKKCQNAILEKKKICQEIQLRRKEHSMLIKENELRLKLMTEQHKIKMFSVLKD